MRRYALRDDRRRSARLHRDPPQLNTGPNVSGRPLGFAGVAVEGLRVPAVHPRSFEREQPLTPKGTPPMDDYESL